MRAMNRIRNWILLTLVMVMTSIILPVTVTMAGENITLTYQVTRKTSEARQMLSLINDLRTKGSWYWNPDNMTKTMIVPGELGELRIDPALEETAMKRAEEIAIYYSHTRPNGESCFSLFPERRMAGENIAVGQDDFQDAFIAWREEEEDYGGQGHRRNMLAKGFTSIGIGCVEKDGIKYWAQSLDNGNRGGELLPPSDLSKIVSVEVKKEFVGKEELRSEDDYYDYEDDSDQNMKIYLGESKKIGDRYPYIQLNSRWYGNSITKKDAPAVRTVMDPDIVSLAEDGTITGLKVGKTKIKYEGKLFGGQIGFAFVDVSVETIDLNDPESDVDIDLYETTYEYTGNPVEPEPELRWRDRVLIKDKDYKLSYYNNIDAGEAGLVIEGLGAFVGRIEETFTIEAIDGSDFVVEGIVDKEYTGKKIYQDFIVFGSHGEKLIEKKDFDVIYEKNVKVGKATLKLQFKGNYYGTSYQYFNIFKKTLSFKKKNKSFEKKVSYSVELKEVGFGGNKKLALLFIPKSSKIVKFRYAINKGMKKSKTLAIKGKKLEIKKLNPRKTYYYQVGSVDGKKIIWTTVKKARVQ